MKNIMLLGESFSTGYGLKPEEAFSYILNNDESFPYNIHNLAEPGGSLDRCYRVGVENYDRISPAYTLCVFPSTSYNRREVFFENKYQKINPWSPSKFNYLIQNEEIKFNRQKNIDAMTYRFKNFMFIDSKQEGFVYDVCISDSWHPGPLWNMCMADYIRKVIK